MNLTRLLLVAFCLCCLYGCKELVEVDENHTETNNNQVNSGSWIGHGFGSVNFGSSSGSASTTYDPEFCKRCPSLCNQK